MSDSTSKDILNVFDEDTESTQIDSEGVGLDWFRNNMNSSIETITLLAQWKVKILSIDEIREEITLDMEELYGRYPSGVFVVDLDGFKNKVNSLENIMVGAKFIWTFRERMNGEHIQYDEICNFSEYKVEFQESLEEEKIELETFLALFS